MKPYLCADSMQGSTVRCCAESSSRLSQDKSKSLDAHQVLVHQLLAVLCHEVHFADAMQDQCVHDSKEPTICIAVTQACHMRLVPLFVEAFCFSLSCCS